MPGPPCRRGWASARRGTCGSPHPRSTSWSDPSSASTPGSPGGPRSHRSSPASRPSRPSTSWRGTSGFGRAVGLILALLVCVSPVCVVYSTRLKEYGTVFLMTCAVLWVAETARRRPARARLVRLAAVSVLAFVVSASMGPVIAGVWIALMLSAARERRSRRDDVVGAVVVAGGCGIVAAIFYRRISPSLSKFWANNYIRHGSVSGFLRSLNGGLCGPLRQPLAPPGAERGWPASAPARPLGPLGVRCRPQRRHARTRLHRGRRRVRQCGPPGTAGDGPDRRVPLPCPPVAVGLGHRPTMGRLARPGQ